MRFMATTLSNLVDNLTREIRKLKCKICSCFLIIKMLRATS